jgi:hypothetical protein
MNEQQMNQKTLPDGEPQTAINEIACVASQERFERMISALVKAGVFLPECFFSKTSQL